MYHLQQLNYDVKAFKRTEQCIYISYILGLRQKWTNKYQLIYKNLVKEAKKKMENDRFFLSSKNKTKGIWQVINKEIGNFPHNCNLQLWNNLELQTPKYFQKSLIPIL